MAGGYRYTKPSHVLTPGGGATTGQKLGGSGSQPEKAVQLPSLPLASPTGRPRQGAAGKDGVFLSSAPASQNTLKKGELREEPSHQDKYLVRNTKRSSTGNFSCDYTALGPWSGKTPRTNEFCDSLG